MKMECLLKFRHMYKHFDNPELHTMDSIAKNKCKNLLKSWFSVFN